MRLILNLNYAKYLLPASANVRELLKSLGSAKRVDFDPEHPTALRYLEREGKCVVEISVVESSQIRTYKKAIASRAKVKPESAHLKSGNA